VSSNADGRKEPPPEGNVPQGQGQPWEQGTPSQSPQQPWQPQPATSPQQPWQPQPPTSPQQPWQPQPAVLPQASSNPPRQPRRSGGVIAALVVGLSVVLFLALSVGIPAFVKHQRLVRANEARHIMARISESALAYFNTVRLNAKGKPLPRCFPSNDGDWVRSDEDMDTGCCPDTCRGGLFNEDGGNGRGWQALKLSLESPRYYKYRFKGSCCNDIECTGGASFTVEAIGDLNCDGVRATCQSRSDVLGEDVTMSPATVTPPDAELE